ncbi:MAG: heavy-metal-associated domain-containing protein [Bacteroidetes bacterium]|nr:heavy-metal-associated domain-containing protein [Bacteroidota bacterium]
MKTETIIIENLKCHGCANTIRKGLSRIEEVSNVDIDVEGSSVKIEYEGVNHMRKIFVEKLRKLGYPEEGTGKLNQQIKSYISCAIGRVNK